MCWLAPVTDWDALFNRRDLADALREMAQRAPALGDIDLAAEALAPIGSQEVWAAGVTYFRSRSARIEESKSAGGGDFYDRVYQRASARAVLQGHAASRRRPGAARSASAAIPSGTCPSRSWRWPSTRSGTIIGYTIGNDMSSRDIEGENPLYLPQAKVYAQCCGLGPALYVSSAPLDPAHRDPTSWSGAPGSGPSRDSASCAA